MRGKVGLLAAVLILGYGSWAVDRIAHKRSCPGSAAGMDELVHQTWDNGPVGRPRTVWERLDLWLVWFRFWFVDGPPQRIHGGIL